eukprot:31265-Pelagococcus_subviridis.AAC.22
MACSPFPLFFSASIKKCCTASCKLLSFLRISSHANACAAELSVLHGCTSLSMIALRISGPTSSDSSSIVHSTFVASSSTSDAFIGFTASSKT